MTQAPDMSHRLADSERNCRAFFDGVGDIFLVAKPDGTLVHANAAATRLLGYSTEELRGRHILDIHPPDRRAEAERVFKEMLEGTRAYCPLPLQRRDGRTLRVESRIWVGQWNGEKCVYGLSKDVSEQEAALQKFDRLFESNPASMAVSRISDRTFTDVNAAFLKTFGYSREEVIGHTSEELRLFPDAEAHGAFARKLQRCGRVRDARLLVRTRDGRTIKGLFAGEIVESHGERVLLTVITDITALESAQETMRLWNAFQGEINTLSQRLVTLPWQEVDAGITDALGHVGAFVRAHRAYVFQFRDGGVMDNTHEWCAEGIEPQIDNLKDLPMATFPWWIRCLRAGETIHIPRVADMGPEAAAEKEILQMQGIESIVVVPLKSGQETAGFLGFDAVNKERTWPEYVPVLLRVVGDILAAIIERRRVDQALHQANITLEARVAERTREVLAESERARRAASELRETVIRLERVNRELDSERESLRRAQADLRESRAMYREIFEASRAPELLIDPATGTIVDANPAAQAFYGYDRAVMKTMRVWDINMLGESGTRERMAKAVSGEHTSFTFQHRLASGEIRDVEVFSGPVCGGGRNLLSSIIMDVTERRRMEAALRLQVERYDLVIRGAHGAIWDWDVVRHKVFFSPQWKALRGYCEDEVGDEEETWSNGIHPDDKPRVLAKLEEHFANRTDVFEDEYRIRCKDGSWKWVMDRGIALRDGQGTVRRMAGSETDITAHRADEEQIAESRQRFENAFEYAAIGMALVAPDGRWLKVNPALCRILGYSESELLAGCFQEFTVQEDLAPELENVRKVLAGEVSTYQMEKRYRHKSGRTVWALLCVSLVRDPGGKPMYFVSQIQDITARKDAERQRAWTLEVLDIVNCGGSLPEVANSLLDAIQRETGVEALAIRIAGEADFRYIAQRGFPAEFVAAEDHLCATGEGGTVLVGSDGKPMLECTCGLVLEGRAGELGSLSSPGGSVWTNDAAASADAKAGVDPRFNPRNLCVKYGYRSVALVPIRSGKDIVGLLQLNDRQAGVFSAELIGFLEGISSSMGIALSRRQSEDKLRNNMRHLALALDGAKAGAWEWDLRTNRNTWSESIWPLYGLDPRTEPSYDSWLMAIHPADRERAFQTVQAAARTGGEINGEWRVHLPSGDVRWLVSRGRPIIGADGGVERYLGVVMDITDRKRAEAEQRRLQSQLVVAQKMESIGQLAAGVAHELNNPLGFLMNNFAALEDDVAAFRGLIADYRALRQRAASVPALAGVTARLAEKEEAARLDFILGDLDGLFRESRDGFTRATGIVDTLRNFARDERRDEKTEYDLNEGVKSTLVLARNEYKYHSEVNPEYGDIPRVLCAPGQINQVLLNLVVNAAQAIASQKRAGKGTIRVRTFADDEWVCCDVADDGPGIPANVREKIMEPFFTTKPPGQGTGLGLAICYDIVVTRHGGTLTVDSREGEGAVFHVRLPRKAST